MRAAVFDRFGPPEVLRVAELPDLEPGPGQVRVRVRAAGVQPVDVKIRQGAIPWAKVSFPQTIGQEYSGVIDRLGEDVDGFAVGDTVLGSTMLAGQAAQVVVPVKDLVRKPDHLDFPTAAALVSAAQTASGALRDLAVGPRDVLLVHAAAGSVGTVAVQLARLAGATVIGTASPGNHDYLRQLGAIPVAYGDDLPQAVRAVAAELPTVALDAAGGDAVAQSVALGIPRDPARLAEVVALAARGVITMPIRAYPLAEVADAHAAVESRHGRGKVVLIVEP